MEMVSDPFMLLDSSAHNDDVFDIHDIFDVHTNHGKVRIFPKSRPNHWIQGCFNDFGYTELYMSFIYGTKETSSGYDNTLYDNYYISYPGSND